MNLNKTQKECIAKFIPTFKKYLEAPTGMQTWMKDANGFRAGRVSCFSWRFAQFVFQ